jgi:hypothetical protein
MITQLRQMAKDAGRDRQALEVIVGANNAITAEPLGAERMIFTGSLDQVKTDIAAVKRLGADEIFFMIVPDGPMKDLLAAMERYRGFI